MQLFCISSKLNTYLRSFLKGHFMNTLNSDFLMEIRRFNKHIYENSLHEGWNAIFPH